MKLGRIMVPKYFGADLETYCHIAADVNGANVQIGVKGSSIDSNIEVIALGT